MALVDLTLTFDSFINASIQEGDIVVYYPITGEVGEFDVAAANPVVIGPVLNVTNTTIVCSFDTANLPGPTTSSFFFFIKDGVVNESSIKGYYAGITFNNNSSGPAELYAVACDVYESSK